MIRLSGSSSRSSLYLVLFGAVAAVLAGFAVAYVDVGPMGMLRIPELGVAIVILVVVAVTAILLVGRYLPFAIWSPIYGFVAVYLIIGIVGYVYYRLSTSYLGSFYDVGVSEAELVQALSGFFVAIASFLVGAMIYLLLSRRFQRLRRSKAHQAVSGAGRVINSCPPRFSVLSLAPLLVPFLLFVVGKGPGNLWLRSEYLVEQYHFFHVMGALLSLPAVLVIGYMLPAKKSILWQISCLGLFVTYELMFLSSSSREFFIIPLFFIVGLALRGTRRRTLALLIVTWILASPLLSIVPLELRGMSEQGLSPLPSNLEEIITQDASVEYFSAADTLIKNTAFSVPQAGYVKNAAPIPKDQFLTSINPLPSFIPVSGLPLWGDFSDQLKISPFQPFSALGELLNQGWLYLSLYYVAVGLVAAWVDIGARVFEGQRSRWGFLIACGMLDLFAITSTQYNLRSSTRFIVYAILVTVVWKILCRIRVSYRRR